MINHHLVVFVQHDLGELRGLLLLVDATIEGASPSHAHQE